MKNLPKDHKAFRDICREVQKEFPHRTLEQIVMYVRDAFECAQEHIKEGTLTPVYYQGLGRFRVKPGRLNYLRQKQKERHDNDQQRKLHESGDSADSSEE